MIPSVFKWVGVSLLSAGENWVTDNVELRWCAEDPFAVLMTFSETHGGLSWVVGRELLREGCSVDVGVGDVLFRRAPFRPWAVAMHLRNPFPRPGTPANGVVQFSRESLLRFIGLTECVVPIGEESIDFDGWLEGVLREGVV